MLSPVTVRSMAAAALGLAVLMGVAGCTKTDNRYEDFLTLGRQRGVITDPPQTERATASLADNLCSDEFSSSYYMTLATRTEAYDPSWTIKRAMAWYATLIDVYCPDKRSRIEQGAERAGVPLPPRAHAI